MARCVVKTAAICLSTASSPEIKVIHRHIFPTFLSYLSLRHSVTHIGHTSMSDYTTKGSLNSASFDQLEEASTDNILIMDEKRRTSVVGQPAHQEHGPLVDHKIPQEDAVQAQPDLAWSRIRYTLREPLSEFFGVFILILFGDGVVAQVVLSSGEKGDYQSISWGWGLGVMLGVYTGGISGAHLNPAVTFANCVFRRFPWRKFPIYMLAQILGAMAASAVVYANYKSAFDVYEGGAGIRTVSGPTATAGIFCTYPQPCK